MRLKEYVDLIDSDYLIYLQEDWLVINDIDDEKITYLVHYMKDNAIEFMMSYTRGREEFIEKSKYDGYDFFKINGHYMQPAIWEKKLFMKIINMNVNISEYESNIVNSITANANCYAIKYTKTHDVSIPTLYYPHMHAICGGKWTFVKYPKLKELVESYGIDTTSRGINETWIVHFQ